MVTVTNIRLNFHCFRGLMLQKPNLIVDVVGVASVQIQENFKVLYLGSDFYVCKAKGGCPRGFSFSFYIPSHAYQTIRPGSQVGVRYFKYNLRDQGCIV